MNKINAQQLRQRYDDGGELAVLDVREEGVYSRDGHLLRVSNVPLSVLELRARALLPRLATRIVVCDGGEGLADIAAQKLVAGGYTDVCVLGGGTPAWQLIGGRLYTGVYLPSKAFGEYIQHEDAPREVTATELNDWMKAGKDMVVVDSRPLAEFNRNSIPGALDCPSAELPYRMPEFLRSPDTTVVVNCGGRTRSIIGAQVLINAGLPNPVYALKDGTQGWKLAGFQLNHGRSGWRSGLAFVISMRNGCSSYVPMRRALCICWMCAIPRNSNRAMCPARSLRPAGSWCRRPIPLSPCVLLSWCSPTMTAFAQR
jgi:rhodanese-related sulfurtransferase